jgi:membrane protein implicated in regulation of membrane protease activity
MPWWVWLVLGLILLGGETITPGGFYLLFFGVGGLAVGLIGLAGLELAPWAQWLLFTVLSVTLILVLRPRLVGRLQTPEGGVEDTLVGEWVTLASAVPPGGIGRGELRGSAWAVQNGGDTPLAAGERCRVQRVIGLTLHVGK